MHNRRAMSLKDNSEVLFTEEQQFRQKWIRCIAVGIPLLIVMIIALNVFKHQNGSNSDLFISLLAAIIIVLLVGYLLWITTLKTVIDMEGLTYRFVPFHRSPRHIAWDQVSSAVVRQYRPIVEYGGWGLRWGFSGLAYNVSGNMGLQLVLKNSRRVLIGTQKPNELEQVVQHLQKKEIIPTVV